MSRSLNVVQLLGNVGNDPEVKTPTSNSRVATFSLATSRAWKDAKGAKQEKTEWHRLQVWGTLADVVEKYVKKGDKLHVTGSIEYRQWKDKEGQTRYSTEINVRDLIMLGGRTREEDFPEPVGAGAKRSSNFDDFPAALQDEPDDLPF